MTESAPDSPARDVSLVLEEVTKVYPSGRRALDGVSLEVPPGVFGMLGPNGAGKSTLMSILAGSSACERGRVRLMPEGLSPARNPTGWRRRLGYMPQTFDFEANLTAREVLLRHAALAGVRVWRLRKRIDWFLDTVNLLPHADREAATFSRGMKQRLGVAAVFLIDPELVLLDEPTAGLDPQERIFFRDLLSSMARDRVVILSTHIVPDIERCCERLAVLAQGRVRHIGSIDSLIHKADNRTWEGVARVHPDQLTQDGSYQLANLTTRSADGTLMARVVTRSGQPPEFLADPQSRPPRLEDGYLALLQDEVVPMAGAVT